MENYLNFDLIAFRNLLEFAIEKCEPVNYFS